MSQIFNRTLLAKGGRRILETLEAAGKEAYLVGGAVRDLLLHKEPHDFDILTSARPEEVIEIMEKAGYKTTNLVGKTFGIVVVAVPEGHYEVATFRSEVYGADSHRPAKVTYADSLEEDVERRDFTINAMAMDINGQIYDYVEGQRDIKKRRLRTVGAPVRRFQEDALRLFRACRFVGQLDFMPDKSLLKAMPEAFYRVSGLSLERVREELDKLLLAPSAPKGLDVLVQSGLAACSCRITENGQAIEVPILPELSHLVNLPQHAAFHRFDGWYHTLAVVDNTPADLLLRWAALLHDVGKGMPDVRGFHKGHITDYGHDEVGADMAAEIVKRLRYPKAFADRVSWLVRNHMHFVYFLRESKANALKWVRKEARSGLFRRSEDLAEAFKQQAYICAADALGTGYGDERSVAAMQGMGQYLQALARSVPIHTRDLAYPKELPQVCGKDTGRILQNLLLRVQNGQLENTSEVLMAAAKKHRERLEKKKNIAQVKED